MGSRPGSGASDPLTMALSRTLLPALAACGGMLLAQPQDGATKALEAVIQRQQETLARVKARLGALESYARAQASAEEAFVTATRAAREAGFAAGINPHSRELLLEAWAARAAAAAKGLPGAPEPSAPEEGRRPRRRD